jgi:putative acetyltransferase
VRPDVIIRAYEQADIPAVTRLYNQRSVAAGTLQIPLMPESERAARYTPGPDLRMIVAELNGHVVGHAGLHLYRGRRQHVASIGMGVDDAHQGQGIGSRLMEALLDLADNWYNIARVELTVYADNARAIHLYRKYGFVDEGLHRNYAFREGEFVDVLSMARLRNP